MGRVKSKVWNEFIERKVNGRIGVECKHCNLFYNFKNATKMYLHIVKCVKCPLNVRKTYTWNHQKDKVKNYEDNAEDSALSSLNFLDNSKDPTSSICSSSSATLSSITDQSSQSVVKASSNERNYKIHNFFDSMNPLQKENLDKKIAKAIYTTGAPLGMLEHPWKEVFRECRPSYEVPSRYVLSTTLLENEFNNTKKEVDELVSSAKYLHLQCDGWTNIRNDGIMNFLVSTPRPVFVKSVATGTNRHTSDYIASEIKQVLIEFNPHRFFSLIGDNAANVQKSFSLIKNQYPHLIPLSCLAHTLNLLFNDITSIQSISDIKSNCILVIKTINRSQVLRASLENVNKDQKIMCSLKLPVPTRWASFYYSLESLSITKVSLQILAVRDSIIPSSIKKLILDDSFFWNDVNRMITLLKPMVSWITKLESDTPNIHTVYKCIKEIDTGFKDFVQSSDLCRSSDEQSLLLIFENRKKNMLKPVHLAAVLLDPSDQGSSLLPEENIDASEFIYEVSESTGNNSQSIMSELANYKTKSSGLWGKKCLWESITDMEPIVWWQGFCSSSLLSTIAIIILTTPTTSAATERSFSTYSNIHTKKRNRLTCDRAGKLTFISHNWKLLNNSPTKCKSLKICNSSTNKLDLVDNIIDDEYYTSSENTSDDESLIIPYADTTSDLASDSETEVEVVTLSDTFNDYSAYET